MMNDDIDLTNYIKIGEFRVNKDQVGCQFNNPFLLEMALQDFIEQLDAQYECRKGQDDEVSYIQTDVYRKEDAETLDDVWEDDLQFVFVQKVILDEIIEIVDDEDDGPENGETDETELPEDSDYTRKCNDKYKLRHTHLGWIDISSDNIIYNLVNVDESTSKAIQQYFLKHYFKELSEESKRLEKRVFVAVDMKKDCDLKKDMKEAITLTKLIHLN